MKRRIVLATEPRLRLSGRPFEHPKLSEAESPSSPRPCDFAPGQAMDRLTRRGAARVQCMPTTRPDSVAALSRRN
jgi:hypothetical protein